MSKQLTLFQEIMQKLFENVIPSIVFDLKRTGMRYSHSQIPAQHTFCFFTHKGIDFPFNIEQLPRIKYDKGNHFSTVILNISCDGQISISENITIGLDGFAQTGNTCILYEHYEEMFNDFRIENTALFFLSKELTTKAKQFNEDVNILLSLLNDMSTVNPKITRKVLIEKTNKQ